MKKINQVKIEFPENRDELIALAIAEYDGCISVGGLALQLGLFEKVEKVEKDPDSSGE